MESRRYRIALADAYHDEAEMYRTSLEHYGFDVTCITVPDVGDAAETIACVRPDAVVTRILPGRFGVLLTEELRKDPRTTNIPIIVITSLSQPEALTSVRSAGADEIVLLPSAPDDLANVITRCTKERRPTRAR